MNRPSSQSSDANKSADFSTDGFLSPSPNKAPSQTSDHSSPGDPGFLYPKHPGPFSPSPKKNIQPPFSSPTNPSKLLVHPDGSKIQSRQSDGSKVFTSQSDGSSTGATSQSDGDDALVSPSQGKLTTLVQSKLLDVETRLPPLGMFSGGSIDPYRFPYPANPAASMLDFIHPLFHRPYNIPSFLHATGPLVNHETLDRNAGFLYNISDSTGPNLEPVNLTRPRKPVSCTTSKPPIASSVNLKTIADGMKMKLKTALLASPRLLNPKPATVSSAKQVNVAPAEKDTWPKTLQVPRGIQATSNDSSIKSLLFGESEETHDPLIPSMVEADVSCEQTAKKKQKLVSLLNQKVHETDYDVTERILKVEPNSTGRNVFADTTSSRDFDNGGKAEFFQKSHTMTTELLPSAGTAPISEHKEIRQTDEDCLYVHMLKEGPVARTGVASPQTYRTSPNSEQTSTSAKDKEAKVSHLSTVPQYEAVDLETMIPTLQIRAPRSDSTQTANRKEVNTPSVTIESDATNTQLNDMKIRDQVSLTSSITFDSVADKGESPPPVVDSGGCRDGETVDPTSQPEYNADTSQYCKVDPTDCEMPREIGDIVCGKDSSEVDGNKGLVSETTQGNVTDSQTRDQSVSTGHCGIPPDLSFGDSSIPMEDIVPSVTPGQLSLGAYDPNLYEFLSDDDTDEHALTIDMDG